MPIEPNDLESRRFGIAAARVTDPAAGPAAAHDAGIDMATVRIGTDDIALVQAYEAAG